MRHETLEWSVITREDRSRRCYHVWALGVAILLLIMPGCQHRAVSSGEVIKPELMHQLRSFSALGANDALVILERTRELRVTKNGGETWQAVPGGAGVDAFECATMIDALRGWAVNHDGQVFTTDSGGTNWTRISEIKDFTGANEIRFLNENDGWIREFLSIWRTRDGGVTWHKTLSTVTPGVIGQPTGMFVFDANTLVGTGGGGEVYSTKNGGETWKVVNPFGGDRIGLDDVWFVDRLHGWVIGTQVIVGGDTSRPLVFETVDGGESWKQLEVFADIQPWSICFVGDNGWLAGSRRIVSGDSVTLEGVLLHSTDGGNRWERIQLGANEPYLTDVRFADKDHGWLIGRNTIYRTEDGGKIWRQVLSLGDNIVD